jgi:hypothetical protein
MVYRLRKLVAYFLSYAQRIAQIPNQGLMFGKNGFGVDFLIGKFETIINFELTGLKFGLTNG